METALQPQVQADQPLSVEAVTKNIYLVKEILQKAMQEGIHYGTIPGCKKPSLWQPGAELIDLAFRLRPTYPPELIIEIYKPEEQFYSVKATCHLLHIKTGLIVGEATAEANTREKKFKRQLVGDTTVDDFRNTILAMAQKRAHVRATRGATAASEIFDYEMEAEENVPPKQEKPSPPERGKETPSGTYQTKAVRAFIENNIYPALKSLIIREGEEGQRRAQKLLQTRLGVARFVDLTMKQAQAFADFLGEWKLGVCTVRWNESKLDWDVEYPPKEEERE